ncbi:MAG: SHOCT domain-containing protein [Dermatophilaceae bacterium]
MMWGNGYAMGWGMWLLIGLGTIGFWVLIAVVVRALMTGNARSSTGGSDALQVLNDRLARGEIDIEEYQYRRRLIVDGH